MQCDASGAFPPSLFQRAESEGLNLYARMDLSSGGLNAANPMQRWAFVPHIRLGWNYDCSKLHYVPPKNNREQLRGGTLSVAPATLAMRAHSTTSASSLRNVNNIGGGHNFNGGGTNTNIKSTNYIRPATVAGVSNNHNVPKLNSPPGPPPGSSNSNYIINSNSGPQSQRPHWCSSTRARSQSKVTEQQYIPWYARDGLKSAVRLGTAPAKVEPFRLKYNFSRTCSTPVTGGGGGSLTLSQLENKLFKY